MSIVKTSAGLSFKGGCGEGIVKQCDVNNSIIAFCKIKKLFTIIIKVIKFKNKRGGKRT